MKPLKKTLIFCELMKGFNEPTKNLSGMLSFEPKNNGYQCTVTIMNAIISSAKWYLYLKINHDESIYPIKPIKTLFETGDFDSTAFIEAVVVTMENKKINAILYASTMGNSGSLAAGENAVRKLRSIFDEADKKPFYKKNSNELLTIFNNNEVYKPLMKKFKNSYWVKITKKSAYYFVGIIMDKEPKYICYAMPQRYYNHEDENFLFYTGDEAEIAYFIAFRDAQTGKIEKQPQLEFN